MNQNLTFGGVNTADYGIYLTGAGTFSAPERDVEYVAVPGRNGDLLIDNGRWRNIEVTYPANIPREFEYRLPEYRARICAKRGYQRLEDTYHPDEYRMASFTSGLQPKPTPLNNGGQFDLVFNCKPQRYLKSGDKPVMLMPWVPTTYRTQYIIATGSSVSYKVNAPEGDELTLKFSLYDGTPTQTDASTATVEDGDTGSFTFTPGSDARFWRLEITNGVTDADATSLELEFDLNYFISGVEHVKATFGRYFVLENPTGYASKPLLDYWGTIIPNTTWENYVDGTEQVYYQFSTSYISTVARIYMDCDLQYLYDVNKNNLTSNLTLTTTGSGIGEGMTFPQFSEDETRITMYYTTSDIDFGPGIVCVYPHWWTL